MTSLPIRINPDSAEPLYHQIGTQMKALIYSGQLKAGTLLPSIRELAQQTQCSVITIRRVYQDLETEGFVRTRQGTGTFVAQVEGETRDKFQREAVKDALVHALQRIRHSGLSVEEIRGIFESALQETFNGEAGR
ncbi:GntR family transcriptional regulator [Paenibacillus sp. TRM 82003]|nr:GntR family transcriptional regulator [Paenibacillus sp. TRM 82003]